MNSENNLVLPILYHYNRDTFEYVGTSTGRLDPIDKNPLIPAFSTMIEPPTVSVNKAAIFNVDEEKWEIISDFRGHVFYTEDGKEIIIQDLGEVAEDLLNEKPVKPLTWEDVRMQRDSLLFQSDWTQMLDAPLNETMRLAWAEYRQALRDVPQEYNSPDTVVWPEIPA